MLDHNKPESFTILFMGRIGSKFSSGTSFSVGYKSHWTWYIISNIVPYVNKNAMNLKFKERLNKLGSIYLVNL